LTKVLEQYLTLINLPPKHYPDSYRDGVLEILWQENFRFLPDNSEFYINYL